jgi:cation diffusion facilitator family transporter
MDDQQHKTAVALLSIVSNSILVALKVITGLLTGSISIISEAVHSSMDLAASVIAFFAVRISAKRPDAEHPFGHGKVEDISALAEALLILIAAAWIILEAVHKLIEPKPIETIGWGLAVMAFSAIANIIVSNLLFMVGRKTESPALIADAWHLKTDVWTSAGVLSGLAIIWFGSLFWPGVDLSWIDPVAAILVALLILRAALKLTLDAIKDLIDTRPPANEITWLSGYFASWFPTVRSVHRVRTRKSGAARFIDLHVVVDPSMTVSESHSITEKMTAAIREKLRGADLTVHVEPCDGSCKKACVSGCMMSSEERRRLQSASVNSN